MGARATAAGRRVAPLRPHPEDGHQDRPLHLGDARGGGPRSADTGFSASIVPTASELQRVCKYPRAAKCKAALALQYARDDLVMHDAPEDVCSGRTFDLHSLLLAVADGKAFVGSARGRVQALGMKACAAGAGPARTRCLLAAQHHMDIAELLSATRAAPANTIWPLKGARPTSSSAPMSRRLIVLLREPVSRMISELKHVNAHARSRPDAQNAWDFCTHECLRNTSVRDATDAQFDALIRCFVLEEAHAFAVDNRQTRMLSGMTVAPSALTPNATVAGLTRTEWEMRSLHVALATVQAAELILLAHRLPESIALILHRFNWVPSEPRDKSTVEGALNVTLSCHTYCTTQGLSWDQLVAAGGVLANNHRYLNAEDGRDYSVLDDKFKEFVAKYDSLVRVDRTLLLFAESLFNQRVEATRAVRDRMTHNAGV